MGFVPVGFVLKKEEKNDTISLEDLIENYSGNILGLKEKEKAGETN